MNPSASDELWVGVDDATKCPCIGSIFVSAVAASPRIVRRWRRLGVKDSKLLSRKRRDALAPVILAEAAAVLVREITPAQIDDKRRNLNDWEMLTVLQMVHDLRPAGRVTRTIVDNWEVSADWFETRRRACLAAARSAEGVPGFCLGPSIDDVVFTPEHHADENHTIVGAASILSKSASDRQYDAYRLAYGDFGSGSPGDPKTRRFVWTHRLNPPPIVRTSWNTFRHLSRLADLSEDVWSRPRSERRAGEPIAGSPGILRTEPKEDDMARQRRTTQTRRTENNRQERTLGASLRFKQVKNAGAAARRKKPA